MHVLARKMYFLEATPSWILTASCFLNPASKSISICGELRLFTFKVMVERWLLIPGVLLIVSAWLDCLFFPLELSFADLLYST